MIIDEVKNGSKRIRIGTRGSQLALAQTKFIQAELERVAPEVATTLEIIKTAADKDVVTSLRAPAIGGIAGATGVFVKELEQALLAGEIDMAVHSLKDVPTVLADGLVIAAIPERASAADALIIRRAPDSEPAPDFLPLPELPYGARVGTGSFRRQAQLLRLRHDLRIMDIRGNVDTRLQKLEMGQYDAVVLAVAGLGRLGLGDRVTRRLEFHEMLPAPGQGALAIETRATDEFTKTVVARLNHEPTALAVSAERDFLERLGGGCNVPIAAYARVERDMFRIDGAILSPTGAHIVRDVAAGGVEKSAYWTAYLAFRLLGEGGQGLLDEFRNI